MTRALTQREMDLSDRMLNFMVKVIPVVGALLLGYNTYLQIHQNKDSLLSAFSVAVFLIFLVSVGSITYGHSLARQGSEKEKATAAVVVICLYSFIGAAFLIRAWAVLPQERTWLVPTSCAIPISALMGFLFLRRKLAKA